MLLVLGAGQVDVESSHVVRLLERARCARPLPPSTLVNAQSMLASCLLWPPQTAMLTVADCKPPCLLAKLANLHACCGFLLQGLIFVMTRMQIQMEHYPRW